jgi:hypothetical protein
MQACDSAAELLRLAAAVQWLRLAMRGDGGLKCYRNVVVTRGFRIVRGVDRCGIERDAVHAITCSG